MYEDASNRHQVINEMSDVEDETPQPREYDDPPSENQIPSLQDQEGYEEVRPQDGGGYELPLQAMTCITYKENKPPTPENSTL